MRILAAAILASAAAAALAGAPSRPALNGERAFQKCYACHSVDPAEKGLSGPNLRGIVGRSIAAQPGFEYSPALLRLRRSKGRWSADLLDRYIADPERVAPGTTMTFTGMRDARERAALARYLAGKR